MPPVPVPNPSWLTLIVLSIISRLRKSKRETRFPAIRGTKPTYCVMIPAHNEQNTIHQTLRSCADQTIRPERVFILDDHSECDYQASVDTDYPSANIVKFETRNGKAFNIGKEIHNVTTDYVLVLDADSSLAPDYMEKILAKAPFDVAFGTVLPDDESVKNVYGRHRLIEYAFGQAVWKTAFNYMGSPNITGCFAVYKTDVLTQNGFPSRTVTEDLDLCWAVLEENGKVLYVSEAQGYTREPQSLAEYSGQVQRWYQGFWQCLKVHGADRVGVNDSLTLSLNFVMADQLILAPIWFVFLLGSLIVGLSQLPAFASSFGQIASNSIVSLFVASWHRWFPFAFIPLLALSSLLFDIGVTALLTLAWARKFGRMRQAAAALPAFYLLSWFNRFVFWTSGLRTLHWSRSQEGKTW